MKFKLASLKWFILFLVSIAINFHVTYMVMRSYDKTPASTLQTNTQIKETSQQDASNSVPGVVGNVGFEEVAQETAMSQSLLAQPFEEAEGTGSGSVAEALEALRSGREVYNAYANAINNSTASAHIFVSGMHKSKLPSFVVDESEFIYSSLIERAFDTWDLKLTTFFLSHHVMEPIDMNMAREKVHPATKNLWKKASAKFQESYPEREYYKSGMRTKKYTFYCRIWNSELEPAYVVEGKFLPNRLTSDSNANRRLDIFRCPIAEAAAAYQNYARSSHELHVEILRNETSLINFTVPWDTRRAGYLLTHPPQSSRLDSWGGFQPGDTTPPTSQPLKDPIVHVIIPGTNQLPSQKTLPIFLEFVSHHLLIGAAHVYLPVPVGWKSPHMSHILSVFESYIEEGKLSVICQSGDGIDMIYSIGGLSWNRYAIKVFQSNMFLFYAKGLADYVTVLDIDEFFIPRGGYTTIGQVILAGEAPQPLVPWDASRELDEFIDQWATVRNESHPAGSQWYGGRGWADGEAHPLCYFVISSEVVAHKRVTSYVDPFHPWMGDRYSHGSEPKTSPGTLTRHSYPKAILPTRVIFQAGLSMGGACRLDWKWTSCTGPEQEFCGDALDDPRRNGQFKNGVMVDFRKDHRYDDVVTGRDAKQLDPKSQAILYHFLLFRDSISASAEALTNQSDYTKYYFSNVMRDLKKRKLDILVTLPNVAERPSTTEEQWTKLFTAEEIANAAMMRKIEEAAAVDIEFPPIPDNFSTRHLLTEVKLPNFAHNFTEYILGSMVERVSDSFDLYLTTFFLCHGLLEPKVGLSAVSGEKIHPEVVDIWKKAMVNFEDTKYHDNGERVQPPHMYCKIRHTERSKPYVVQGRFVPNRLTPDANSNRRMDIFRCKMEDTEHAYMELARSETESLIVEILRDDESIITFRVPWLTRSAGYMLERPLEATSFDPWKGFDKSKPGVWEHDDFYMAVPGMETPPDKDSLPLYLEFVQHHIVLGVQHFFLGSLFSWDSIHMERLMRFLESYIAEGKITISTMCGDGYSSVYSTGGLMWGRDNVKNFHVNMFTYYSKGVADYVGVWDYDEHFWPLGNNTSIMDVVHKLDAPTPLKYFHSPNASNVEMIYNWGGGRGLADGDGHPFCYLILSSRVTLYQRAHMTYSAAQPWLGQRFAHDAELLGESGLGFKKSIRPTRTIFNGGLHMAGACRLPKEWNGCAEDVDFCYGNNGALTRYTYFQNGSAINFNLNHHFDEVVMDPDAKQVNPHTEAVINHLQYHRFWFGASPEALATQGVYVRDGYFRRVYEELDRRGLELPVSMPETAQKPFPEPDDNWIFVRIGQLAAWWPLCCIPVGIHRCYH
jgi:hypothetical protein